MVEPLAIAGLQLAAKFAPDLINLFSKDKGERAEKVSETVMSVAKALTGESEEESALQVLSSDPELAYKFRIELMKDKYIEEQMRLADVKDARDMYKTTDHSTADKIADSVFKWNLWLVFALVAANIGVMTMITNPVVASALSTVIGGSITYLYQERRTVLEFFFGSSQGSKDKTQLINKNK